MPRPAPLAHRGTSVPVFTLHGEPGVPPLWVMRLDAAALARVGDGTHVHDFPVLVYFEDAGGSLTHDNHSRRIAPGDAYLIRPGAGVGVDDPEGFLAARGWGLFFTAEALSWIDHAGPGAVGPLGWRIHPLLRISAGGDDELVRLSVPAAERPGWSAGLRTIERELRERREGYRQAALSQLVLLLVAAARLATDQHARDDTTGTAPLDEVFGVIERGFRGPLSLAAVAGAVHLSPGHLTTSVRQASGRTVQEWITERRLIEARRLLRETVLPVHEIGRRVGYPDPTYFARVFRRANGVTPRSWRAAAG